MTLYEKIKKLCEDRGFAISNISKHIPNLSVSMPSINGWKNGSKPRADKLHIMSEYFGVPIEYFTDDTEENSKYVKIPVYGQIAAGIPFEAIQEILDYEEIPRALLRGGEYFALQVRGDSMQPRICSGDVVILRKQEECESGDIAAVMINGNEATLKKVIYRSNGISLIPLNPAYQTQNYSYEDIIRLPVKIIGVAKEIRGKL